ncbi:M14 family metallopeptidase [Metabacillus endolithicus]|uniref:M14 family metallopeptidase n=1 Tax=Metabacillus endolithicus TaxID=1535204 RepID=A0ABW5BZM9_9BACI|nr:M14 family zinc carboxypeptidase [Metabacillus endolithicus]UPG65598.1 M14 family metallopeptidase [Metabacillus endolithicus]
MKKRFSGLLAFLLVLALFAQSAIPVSATETAENYEVIELETNRTLLSLTETRTVEVMADFGGNVDFSQLEFLFGGKSLSEWKKWSGGTSYNGDPFITVIEEPHFVDGTTTIKATLEFDLLYDRDNLSNRTIRTQYQQFIGDYELALVDKASKKKAVQTVELNVYDQFHFYEELKPTIDSVFEEAEETNDRYLEYQSFGKSVEGRDLHFVVLAKDKEAVDKYLNETLPTALEDPESLLEKLEDGEMGDYQVPVWINNIHPDEVEGVDAQVELFKKFALEDEITFNTIENKQEKAVTLNVDDVLDDVIFLYMFTNNPDGRVANTRANANGFDLNRDNHYQTQIETQEVTQEIAKWTPLSFLDMHGYVGGFLIEPTTPPHNPNFEYDLLYGNMIEQAHAMGDAGISNSAYDSYEIPALDYGDGWDDMTPAYTAMYAMLHGSLGHTIETPALSQNGYDAMYATGLGATLYVTENKDELYKNQLEIFKRGVNGEDNRAVDEYFVNASGESIGRTRGENENFFPEYYVIPVHEKGQKNPLEATKMVEYLLRNGVKVEQTTKTAKVNGTAYPKGTYIVPMNQAKRGLANAMLYKGDDVSDWGAMYDPIVVNFSDLRGFDLDEVREENAFAKVTKEVDSVTLPTGDVVGKAPKQILSNTNNDTVKLINELLKDGKVVEKAMETKGKVNKGDYIVNTKDLVQYEDFYYEASSAGTTQNIKTEKLTLPKVAVTGSAQLKFSLKELGFELVNSTEDADVVVSDGSSFDVNSLDGKAYVGIGVYALNAVKNSEVLGEGYSFDYTSPGHEGLLKANVNDHILTSGYEKNELLYTTNGAWITSVPKDAQVLATVSNSDDFYVAGWWPGHDAARGQTLAFTQNLEDSNITLFANDLAFRAHTQSSYRLLANSIFASVGSEVAKKGKGSVKDKSSKQNNKVEKSFLEKGRDRE